jgi:hypothetical protein
MSFAAAEERFHEKEIACLTDWVTDTGSGIMGFDFCDPPKECWDFVQSQFDRFNVPVPENIKDYLKKVASIALNYADWMNPYVFFFGMSDVVFTESWKEFAYEIYDEVSGVRSSVEANPQTLETFVYDPKVGREAFEYCMSHPGLDALPGVLGRDLRWYVFYEAEYQLGGDLEYHDEFGNLKALCTNPDGSLNQTRVNAYCELAVWAAILWMLGPPGRDFRHAFHGVFEVCYEFGECIIYDGGIVNPKYYKRTERSPNSCYKCGLLSWCTELTCIYLDTKPICEYCLNADIGLNLPMVCGTKFCKDLTCRHHPMHGSGDMMGAMRQSGQLSSMVKPNQALNPNKIKYIG